MVKKKYLGGLKLLLLLLFTMLLGTSSTCYASFSDPFTQTEIDQINAYFNTNFTVSQMATAFNNLKNLYPDIDKRNVMFVYPEPYQSDTNRLILLANNGTFGSIPYVYIYKKTTYNYFGICNSSDDIITTNYNYITTFYRNNSFNANTSIAWSGKFYISDTYLIGTPTLDGNILDWSQILTTIPSQSFYYENPETLTNIPVFSKNYIILDDYIPPEPEQPSGDTGTSGTGTITNPSGDITGQIDLSGIENGIQDVNTSINNQGQNIVNQISGDTQKIIDNQNQNNQTLLSSILSFSGDVVIGQIDSIRDIEFDLGNAINDYQTKFFKAGSPSGDLIFEWNGISLFDSPLIPSGDFNISAMVRENDQLGRLHHITQIFSISSVGILLIAGYWNLFLATIGAGSHFLIETETENSALEDNASVDEFSNAIDDFHRNERRIARDNYYKDLVARVRASEIRKAGRK